MVAEEMAVRLLTNLLTLALAGGDRPRLQDAERSEELQFDRNVVRTLSPDTTVLEAECAVEAVDVGEFLALLEEISAAVRHLVRGAVRGAYMGEDPAGR